jgi:hypothetical protein
MSTPAEDRPASARLPWIFAPPFLPFWYAGLGAWWWQVFTSELALSGDGARPLVPAAPALAASLALAGKLGGWLIEAGCYGLFWRSRGLRLPFWRFLCVLLSASVADLVSSALLALARDHPGPMAHWLWPIAGPQLLEGTPFGEPGSLRAAFGTAGLLTGVRILVTAHAQARALAVPLGGALALTLGAWLSTRIALLWTMDLLTGMSPVAG